MGKEEIRRENLNILIKKAGRGINAKLAKAKGCAPPYITSLIKGDRSLNDEDIIIFSKEFGVQPNYFDEDPSLHCADLVSGASQDNLHRLLVEVLTEDTVFKKAIESNIIAFAQASRSGIELRKTQAELKQTQDRTARLEAELLKSQTTIDELMRAVKSLGGSGPPQENHPQKGKVVDERKCKAK